MKTKKAKFYAGSLQDVFVKSRIKNMCTKVGIKNVNRLVYEEIRGILKVFLEELLEKILAVTLFYKRKTVSVNDVYMVMETHLLLKKKKIPHCKETKKMEICLEFARTPFHRYVREICLDHLQYSKYMKKSHIQVMRFQQEAFDLIQYSMEKYLLKLLYEGKLIAMNAKRETLYPKDLKLAKSVHNVQTMSSCCYK